MSTLFENLISRCDRTAALLRHHAARMEVLADRKAAGVCECGDPAMCPFRCFDPPEYPFPPNCLKLKEVNASKGDTIHSG